MLKILLILLTFFSSGNSGRNNIKTLYLIHTVIYDARPEARIFGIVHLILLKFYGLWIGSEGWDENTSSGKPFECKNFMEYTSITERFLKFCITYFSVRIYCFMKRYFIRIIRKKKFLKILRKNFS